MKASSGQVYKRSVVEEELVLKRTKESGLVGERLLPRNRIKEQMN
jgi:hypothetical protein